VSKGGVITAAAAAIVLGIGCGAVSVFSAATPTTNRSDDATGTAPVPPWEERRTYPRSPVPGEGMRPGWSRQNSPMTRPVGNEEWVYVDRFMNTHSPNRWAKFREMPDDSRKDRLRAFVANRYRAMQELKQNDPTLFDMRLKRLKIEDQIFDLGWRINHDGETGPSTTTPPTASSASVQPSTDQMRAQLKLLVGDLVKSRIEERRWRVGQLKDKLANEEARLKEEEGNQEKAIDASMNGIEKQRWPLMGDLVPPAGFQPRREGGRGAPREPAVADVPPANASEAK
jgi:hypothetical protein